MKLNFKHSLLVLLPAALVLGGCKYDDDEIWDKVNSHETRLAQVESQCNSMNNDLNSLQTLVNALSNKVTVNSVTLTADGYVIAFSDGTTATITNGKDGANGIDGKDGTNGTNGTNGKDGVTPVIGVSQDTDGIWYWTLNGTWLTDANGAKVRASADGGTGSVTPQLRIQDGKWQVSYDNGSSWEEVPVSGQASQGGDSIFKSVTTDSEYAYFTLSDNSVIKIPLSQTAVKLQLVFDESLFVKMAGGDVITIPYEVKAADGAVVDIETWESEGWIVEVNQTSDRAGSFKITAPEAYASKQAKIVFILTDNNGGSFVKLVKIEYNEVKASYTVDDAGGELTIPTTSTVTAISADWITVKSTGDALVLDIQSNESTEARTATVTLSDGTVTTITQVQKDAIVLSEPTITIDGYEQDVPIVVNANVDVQAAVTGRTTWLTVSAQTKAMETKTVTVRASLNGRGYQFAAASERSGVVSISGGDAAPVEVTITQSPAPELDKTNFAVVVLSGDNNTTTANNPRGLAKLWDGRLDNPNILHTQSGAAGFNFPHKFTWEVGAAVDIRGFQIWPRTGAGASSPYTDHNPRTFQVWVTSALNAAADNSDYWTSDTWQNDWYKVVDTSIEIPGDEMTSEQKNTAWLSGWAYGIDKLPEKVRYVRLVVINNFSGQNVVNAGEISIYGEP